MNTVILPDREAVATWAADAIERLVRDHPETSIGLAGGSTPAIVHEAVAQRDIDWSSAVAWMTDERWVPPHHPDSNQRMARTTLTEQTGVRFLAPDTTMDTPGQAAETFSNLLVAESISHRPQSLVMLGMGDDGHTASLFPGTTALTADEPYVATRVDKLDTWRLTTTYPFLAKSHAVLFLATGEGKAEMVARIASGADVPAAHVKAESVTWVLDAEAAALL